MALEVFSHATMAWVLPHPEWAPLILATRPVVYTYTLTNPGQASVKILTVGLEPGDDSRVALSGGTCRRGLHVESHKKCSIELTINPLSMGAFKQVLYVQHTGTDSPLWLEISGMVTHEPLIEHTGSFLVNETRAMENRRRLAEQAAERHFARVIARERYDQITPTAAAQAQSELKGHPYFNERQRFDGVDSHLTPNPVDNPEAAHEFNAAQEAQQEQQALRLGLTNMPQFTPKPKPP